MDITLGEVALDESYLIFSTLFFATPFLQANFNTNCLPALVLSLIVTPKDCLAASLKFSLIPHISSHTGLTLALGAVWN